MRKLNVEILKQNITSRAEKQLNENRFSGASAAVYQNGKCVFKGCFGWSGAYGTHFWVDKADNIVAVYMKNSRFDGGSEASTARDFETDVMNSFNK